MLRTILLLTLLLLFADTAPLGPDALPHLIVLDATITAYSPSKRQTQGDPFEMAWKRASINSLHQLRYVAVSRDLLKRFTEGAPLKLGDSIFIEFIVGDTMDERWENRVDVFFRNERLAKLFGNQQRKVIIVIPSIQNP